MTPLEISQIKEIAIKIAYKVSANPELDQLLIDAEKIYKYLIAQID